MSYGVRDQSFIPVGSTAERLPAGTYSYMEPDMAPPYFEALEVKTDELIDISGTAADDVSTDIKAFLEKKAAYKAYGFNHKRGYLLYGPPGTGKSCIAQLIARRFIAEDGVVIVVAPFEMPNAVATMAKSEPGRNVMVLMEDPNEAHLNQGHVLSVLDGTTPVDGLVTVVTTNYKSKMPPRLANRPGRFDRVVLVDRISPAVQLAFLENIQGRVPAGPRPAAAVIAALDGIPLTLAHLKEAFLAHVVLGVALPELRKRFAAMAENANDDDGVVAPTAKPPSFADAIFGRRG